MIYIFLDTATNKIVHQTDLYEDAYFKQVELLGHEVKDRYKEVEIDGWIVRDFGHPTIRLHYKEKMKKKVRIGNAGVIKKRSI